MALKLFFPSIFGLFWLLIIILLGAAARLLFIEMPRHRRRLEAMDTRLRLIDDRLSGIDVWIASRRGLAGPGPDPITPTPAPPPSAPERPSRPTAPITPAQPANENPDQPRESRPEPDNAAARGEVVPPPLDGARDLPEPADAPKQFSLDTLEESLGTTWAIYVGGAAIALGGIFLVRYAIESGLLNPQTRVILGGLLGLFLVAAGTRLRLREVNVAFGAIGGAHVPSVLTAAGTVILFASAYAAHGLYNLIGPGIAFVLLGAIALGALASALLHGPALAGLGLAGAYIAPMLVHTTTPAPWPLVLYLGIVSVAAFALARMRAWLWLAATAAAGAAFWGFLLIAQGVTAEVWRLPAFIHIAAQGAIALAITVVEPNLGRPQERADPDPVATAVAAVFAVLAMFAVVAFPNDQVLQLPFAMIMMALLAGAGFVAPPAASAMVLATAVMGAVLVCWPAADLRPAPADFYGNFLQLIRLPDGVTAFMTFAATTAAGLTALATMMLWQRPRLPALTAGLVALGATLPALVAVTLAYLRITGFGTAISFALIASVVALGFAAAAEFFDRREDQERSPAIQIATGAFAAAAIAALSIALVASLQKGYLTVAFALATLGTAYVADRKRIPMLRYATAALALIVLARVIWDPRIAGNDIGTLPIFNWLLVGYGVPAVCFALSSSFLRRDREDTASHLADTLAILFTALLGIFQIRHFMNDGDAFTPIIGHAELGLHIVLMLALSHALAYLGARRPNPALEVAQTAASAFGIGLVVFGLGFVLNPAFAREAVGGSVPLSTLVPAYLLPGLMALYIARNSADLRPPSHIVVAASLGLVLIFAYAALETRHAFHGADIRLSRGVKDAETWAQTLVWLALAIAYLAYGLIRASWPARAASGLLLAATTIKVGLFDLAGVTGLWRALSFLCLGGVLIAIGMVYQRLVFRAGDLKLRDRSN